MRRNAALRGVERFPLPVEHRRIEFASLPPGFVVRRQRDIGEQRVAVDHVEGVAIGGAIRTGHHAEISRFRIDGVQPAIGAGMQPGNVIADRPDLPARHGVGRDQHGEIGLAAGRRESRGDVVSFSLRVLDADDQHVFGEPAFIARLPARDAQRVAFLAEQRIAAVAGTEALDRKLFREMHDEAAIRIELADGVQAFDELAVARDALESRASHARHDRHVDDDIGAVGDLHAAARVGGVDRAHAVGNDVQRPALHAAVEQRHASSRALRPGPSSCCWGRRLRGSSCR